MVWRYADQSFQYCSLLPSPSIPDPPYSSLLSLLSIPLIIPHTMIYLLCLLSSSNGQNVSVMSLAYCVHQLYPKCLLERWHQIITSEIKIMSLWDLMGDLTCLEGQETLPWGSNLWLHKREGNCICVKGKSTWEVPEMRESSNTYGCNIQSTGNRHILRPGKRGLTMQGQVGHVKKFAISSKNNSNLLKGFKEQTCHALICFY